MKLAEIIRESIIVPNLDADDKASALRQMVGVIAEEYPEFDAEKLYSVVMERERLGSTGIGSGIAIPHARLAGCQQHVVAFGRSRTGIPFDSIDEKSVHLVFLVLGPAKENEAHLRVLARIAKFLHDTNFRDQLITAKDSHEIYEAIAEKDAQHA